MASIRAKANPFKLNREELSELFMDDTELMKAMASVLRLREISKVRHDVHSPCPVTLRVHNTVDDDGSSSDDRLVATDVVICIYVCRA